MQYFQIKKVLSFLSGYNFQTDYKKIRIFYSFVFCLNFLIKYSKKKSENKICKPIIETLYLGKIKKIDINPTKRQVIKNRQINLGFLFFFKPIKPPGILQKENKRIGAICAGL